MKPAIEVKDLSRSYGAVRAVDGISFTIPKGAVCGFVGANGAGKTTTMRILATLDYASAGTSAICGHDVVDHPSEVRRMIGWMPDHFGNYEHMTVLEYLDFFARSLGYKGAERKRRIEEIIEFTDLTDLIDRPSNKLSKGMTQRLGLGRALLHDPQVLIMDEPAAGLDPKARVELKHLIRVLATEGKTIFISSHILSELGEMCDSLLFINQGKIVHHGDADSLKRGADRAGGAVFNIRLHDAGSDRLLDWCSMHPHAEFIDAHREGGRVRLPEDTPERTAALLAAMVRDGLRVIEFHREQRNLEDAFIDMLASLEPARPAATPPHPTPASQSLNPDSRASRPTAIRALRSTSQQSMKAISLLLSLPALAIASPHPNVVLIYVDDLGYGDLGCYGSAVNDTPHIDRLAADGMRFTDYYSASPVCSPSRAALLTGCYPGRVGFDVFGENRDGWVLFPESPEGLHPDERLLPELLGQKGYATMHIGKWHLGDQPEHLPTRHGFDSYFGIPYSNDMCVTVKRDIYPPMPLMRDERVIQEQPTQAALIERYTSEAVDFIQRHRDKPFFLYLAHLHVHLPHYVMEPFVSRSRNGVYGAAVAAVDWSTGAIVAELERLGITDNTIVVFTSDNGSRARKEGGSNAPLRGHKGQTWEGGMRVPCIVRWPARIPAGSLCNALTTAMDFYPTLAALVGHEPASLPKHDGHDVLHLWTGGKNAESPYPAFFYYLRNELHAVRAGDWKLRLAEPEPGKFVANEYELYHLKDDVAESRNVAAGHPEIVSRLAAMMDEKRADLGDSLQGVEGADRRKPAVATDPQPLTKPDPDYPYIEPQYELNQAG